MANELLWQEGAFHKPNPASIVSVLLVFKYKSAQLFILNAFLWNSCLQIRFLDGPEFSEQEQGGYLSAQQKLLHLATKVLKIEDELKKLPPSFVIYLYEIILNETLGIFVHI